MDVLIYLAAMTTVTQDPAGRFTLLTEELRRIRDAQGPGHGIAGRVHLLIWDLIMRVMGLLASLAEQVHTGKLPDPAPARSQDASPRPDGAQSATCDGAGRAVGGRSAGGSAGYPRPQCPATDCARSCSGRKCWC
jgi:hypothetical protein